MSQTIDIERIARLARLTVSEAEAERLEEELGVLLALADGLYDKADEEGEEGVSLVALRGDEAEESVPREVLLDAAPNSSLGWVTVPRVVEEGEL
ncbi:MAG: hypothetical protein IJX94_05240 [Clostridia bacterium]|nr:hypothetical protein [Clostridia bacterium]